MILRLKNTDVRSILAKIGQASTTNITGATNATPISVTSAAHGLTTGDKVVIVNVGGNTAANGLWTVTVVSASVFTLNSSVGNGAYTSGGTVRRVWADMSVEDCTNLEDALNTVAKPDLSASVQSVLEANVNL